MLFLLYRKQMRNFPPIQWLAAGGESGCRWADRALPPSGGGDKRGKDTIWGYAVPTARGKRGQVHRMVPLPPLDSPKPSFAPRRPSVARRNGSYGGSVPGVGQILGRMAALRSACVIRRA